jgi:fumarate reductase subunit D
MTTDEQSRHVSIAPVHTALVAICTVGTILLIWWLLKYSAYGFDFTDESFYVVSMANPFIHDYSHTQFGFVAYPIYNLLDGDIARLRQANILLTFGLAWSLIYIFLLSFALEIKSGRTALLIISAALATSAFINFDSWLLTPSYNSVALQALMITAIGLVISEKNIHKASMIGWSLIGFGGWLAFMAKPSTALALSFGVVLYLLLARKFSIRLLFFSIAVSTSLLLLSAILIDGSIFEFSNRIKRAIDFGKILGSGHTLAQILRVDDFQLSGKANISIALVGLAVCIFISIVYYGNKKWLSVGLFISIVFFAITSLQTVGQINWVLGLGQFQTLMIFGLVFAAVFSGITFGKLSGLKNITPPQWAIACFFLATPHIYAFGTNSNYWQAGGSAAIFWLCAGLVFLKPLIRERVSWSLLLPVAIATQSVTITLLQTGFEQPYRQPQPIRLNNTVLEFGAKKSSLILPDSYAEYISNAISAARRDGFETGTPMIDLSGQSPGLLYALGAESIGQAWNVGGYPGSLSLAKVALSGTQCEKIAIAWVLFEPGGPRSISNDLMLSVGSAFPDGYKRVAVWKTAAGAGGYSAPRYQELYKPISSVEVLNSCNRLRRSIIQG